MIRSAFQPHLSLAREPDGEYTLHSVTLVPSSSYSAGHAERGVPANVRLLPEVESVLLHVRHHGGSNRQVPRLVQHHLTDLALGLREGKTTITAFVMVGNHLLGSASIDATTPGSVRPGIGQGSPTPLDTSDWHAWLDHMSPGPPSLHVTGIVVTPTPGYDVRLVEAAPQGINPRDLILDLAIAAKPGVWPQHVAQTAVRFVKAPAGVEYESALVRFADGASLPIKVENVR